MLDLLKSIKVDISPGPDGIYARLLKDATYCWAFKKIFVSSTATGEVLEGLRVANVVPRLLLGKL